MYSSSSDSSARHIVHFVFRCIDWRRQRWRKKQLRCAHSCVYSCGGDVRTESLTANHEPEHSTAGSSNAAAPSPQTPQPAACAVHARKKVINGP